MSNIRLFALAVLLLIPGLSFANQTASGFCTTGGIKVTTFGSPSSNPVQGSYPGCSITVNIHGGGLATITDANGGPLSNPFTASSLTGFWEFSAVNGFYDVTLSGGTPALPSPVTIVNLLLNDPGTAAITASSFTGSSFISSTALVAGSGIFRCASIDNCLNFRNNGNTLDLVFKKTGAAAGNLPADVLDASAFGGIKVSQFFSNSAQSAATGVLACSASDTCVSFRNQANSADIPGLAKDASDRVIIGGAAGFTASIGNITNGLTVGAGLTVGGASVLQGVTATTITASGEIAPSITGGALGDTAHRFDAFIRNLDVSGTAPFITGTGTANTVPKFISAGAIGNSSISDNGTTVSTSENASIGGALTNGKFDGICYVDGITNATLSAAVACAGATGSIIIPVFAAPALTGNVVIPAGVTTLFLGGTFGQLTLGNFNLTINGPIIAPVSQLFVYNGSGRVTLGIGAIGNGVRSEWFPGATWCDQANAADVAFLGIGGNFYIGQNPTTATCGADISISASHAMVASAGLFNLQTHAILPNGLGASTMCGSWLTNFAYNGAAYAYDVNTQTQTHLHDCQISLGTTALGAIRLRNLSNSFETRAYIRDVYVSASVNTAGQIGILLQADNALSANYHSEIEIQTQLIDIGARFKSLVNNQGPNLNTLSIRCSAHSKCVDEMDGTDNKISASIGGANGGGNGIGFNFCAAGNGGYGVANNTIGPITVEQGSTGGASKTINIASAAGLSQGCGNSTIYGQSNDGTPFTDANGNNSTWNVFMNTNIRTPNAPVIIQLGSCAAPAIQAINSATGLVTTSGGQAEVSVLGVCHVLFAATGITLGSDMVRAWRSVTDPNGSPDTGLSRGAAKETDFGNGTQGDTTGTTKAAAFISGGTGATITGTGACATITTQTGGSSVGRATCTGTTGASTLTITPGITAPNGWTCEVQDQTTRANLLQQTATVAASCTLTATSVTQNDVFVFKAVAF